MIDKLNEILKGIDKDQCDSSDGWWETSSGAEFGAKKLKEVQDLVRKLTLTDVSQQRELLFCGVCDEETKHDVTLRNELHCLKCGNVAKE